MKRPLIIFHLPNNIINILLLLLVVVSLNACNTVKQYDRGKRLQDILWQHQKMVRWGKFSALVMFYDPEKLAQYPMPDTQKLKQIKIVDYNVEYSNFSKDGSEFYQIVEIEYYHERTGVVGHVEDKQVWKFDEAKNHWFLTTAFPTIK